VRKSTRGKKAAAKDETEEEEKEEPAGSDILDASSPLDRDQEGRVEEGDEEEGCSRGDIKGTQI